MDAQRKRDLMEAYKNRRPEMGVIEIKCKATGDSFLGISKDTRADFNGTRIKLESGTHPNKVLEKLWKQYGEAGFELSVLQVLKYDDPLEDHTDELEKMRKERMADMPKAAKLWR